MVGSMQFDQVKGLEFVDGELHGFGVVVDRLVPFNVSTGATMGSPLNLEAVDLTTVTFMRNADSPGSMSMD